MMGKQLELIGEFFGMWRAWDGVRALDCLLTRPEIDPTRIGLTGNSGGGTVTTWLWAIEERITMAAPSCFFTTFLHNLENELPADSEQYPPGILGAGLDMADFIIARAPEPALLLGQHFYFFDRRGLREAFADVEYFYDVLGAPTANRDLFIGPQGHGFSCHNQEAMVAFFAFHAGLAKPTTIKKPRHLQTDDLNVTERGNTIEAGATPIYEWISHRTTELTDKRKKLGTAELKKRLNSLLHLPKRLGSPHYRVLRPLGLEGSTYARYAIESEHNVRALLRKRLTDPAHGHTLDIESELKLYLPHISAEEELLQLDKGQATSIRFRSTRSRRVAARRRRFLCPLWHGLYVPRPCAIIRRKLYRTPRLRHALDPRFTRRRRGEKNTPARSRPGSSDRPLRHTATRWCRPYNIRKCAALLCFLVPNSARILASSQFPPRHPQAF
jgi:hypothetical protein